MWSEEAAWTITESGNACRLRSEDREKGGREITLPLHPTWWCRKENCFGPWRGCSHHIESTWTTHLSGEGEQKMSVRERGRGSGQRERENGKEKEKGKMKRTHNTLNNK